MKVTAVVADITALEGRAAVLAACPSPDILVNNAGGPPIGDFRDWDEAAWQRAVNDNMVTPIMLIRAVVDGMIERRFGRIVNITSRSVKAPLAHLGLSNGARAGLTGFVAGLSRQVARHNVTINNLLPGPFLTGRQEDGLRNLAAKAGQDYDTYLAARVAESPRAASARRRSSVAPARSCAAPTPASSSARIWSSTAARSTRRCDAGVASDERSIQACRVSCRRVAPPRQRHRWTGPSLPWRSIRGSGLDAE